MQITIIFFLLLSFITPAYGVTVIKSIEEYYNAVRAYKMRYKERSLLCVHDIDETVFTPRYEHPLYDKEGIIPLIERYKKRYKEKHDKEISTIGALNKLYPVLQQDPYRPIFMESTTQACIRTINLACNTIFESARAKETHKDTLDQIEAYRLHPNKPAGVTEINFADDSQEGLTDSYYNDGILYTGPRGNKGSSLVAFVQKLAKKPDYIFFIDNRRTHTKEVEEALARVGISCHAFHYKPSKTFNLDVAGPYFDRELEKYEEDQKKRRKLARQEARRKRKRLSETAL